MRAEPFCAGNVTTPHHRPYYAGVHRGLDLSNYDADILDPGKFERLVAAGYTEFIVGVQFPDIARMMIASINATPGAEVRCVYCGYAGWTFGTVEAAIAIAHEFSISWVAFDCESGNGVPPSVQERQQAYLAARDRVQQAGLSVMRYSGHSYWVNEMGGLDIDDPWWLPNYGAFSGVQPPPEPILSVEVNGKTHPIAIHQYSSLPPLEGRARDYNYFIQTPWGTTDMDDDLVLAVYATRDELERLKAGQLSRADAIKSARFRIQDTLDRPEAGDRPPLADALMSHLLAPHEGGPHTHKLTAETETGQG